MTLQDFYNEALEIVEKVSKDYHTECKTRMQAIVFMIRYKSYLKELDENDEL